MAGIPGGHHAVEEVYAPPDRLHNIGRSAHAHKIPGLVLRRIGQGHVQNAVHDLCLLPYRQTADAVALAVHLGALLHTPDPQVFIGAALVDAEEHLAGIHAVRQGVEAVMLRLAPPEPADCTLTGLLHVIIGGRVFHTLVEGHGNIAAQVGLDTHGLLRPHEDSPAIDVGGKCDALLGDLPQPCQGKYLKASGVRQDGAVPVHHFMEPSQCLHHAVSGAKMKVVGVGQLDLAFEVPQIVGAHRALDGPLGAYIHKDGGLYHTAVGT